MARVRWSVSELDQKRLYFVVPSMDLRELLELGAAHDDLLLPGTIYLQCGT